MKRFWIGVLIAVLLGTFGVTADRYGKRQCAEMAALLDACAEAAAADDWSQAEECRSRVVQRWENWTPKAQMLYPGSALSPFDRTVAGLAPLIATQSKSELLVRCAEGKRMLTQLQRGT